MQLQCNALTHFAYEGSNQASLMNTKDKRGYTSDLWLTFLQARSLNRRIKKGEHGTPIRKFVEIETTNAEGRTKVEHARKVYVLFNLDQTEEWDKPEYNKVYALTGETSIANGNSWAESEVLNAS